MNGEKKKIGKEKYIIHLPTQTMHIIFVEYLNQILKIHPFSMMLTNRFIQ